MIEFKAGIIDGILTVKPVIEKIGNDVIIHVPSYPMIQKLTQEIKDGKRDIQQI